MTAMPRPPACWHGSGMHFHVYVHNCMFACYVFACAIAAPGQADRQPDVCAIAVSEVEFKMVTCMVRLQACLAISSYRARVYTLSARLSPPG